MSLRDHRDGRLIRIRNRQPDFVRKAGPHTKELQHVPKLCPDCSGHGMILETYVCPKCQGEGEV